MTTKLMFKDEAREKLLRGANKVANAVGSTLGPQGRNVTISKTKGEPPLITKDGVTVSENIKSLECPWEDIGAQIIKQAARSTAIAAGDGTTTATVLTYELMHRGMEKIDVKRGNEINQIAPNPVDVKRGMEEAAAMVKEKIAEVATRIDASDPLMAHIATISANNDSAIGKLVAEAVQAAGADGLITISFSKTNDTHVSKALGMEIDMGFLDPAFINNPPKNNIEFVNPLIFLYPKKLSYLSEIEQAMVLAKRANRPIVFISDGMDGEALVTLRRNKLEASYPVAALKLPGFGASQREQLEDLAIALGGVVIGTESGIAPHKIELTHFGQCSAIITSREKTTIMGLQGDKEKIEARITQIKNFITDIESSPYEKKILEKRVARLQGRMATIHIGAPTEIERDEKRYRIDDAVCAAKAALESGIVPGGGTAYFKISKGMSHYESETSGFDVGWNAVVYSIRKIYETILHNSGGSFLPVAPHELPEFKENFNVGWNAKTCSVEDLMSTGVIDPAKVITSALENAVSAASMFLLTDCSIVED